MLPFCSNVFNNSSIGNYYESLPFAHDQQPFSIPSPSCELASIVSSSSKQAQDLVGSTYHDHMHPPFSHLYFPSPLEDDDVILQQHLQQQQLLHQQQQQQQKPVTMMKKSCKKDRHSKIRTARGLRDRRMRLSLDVAKKFFGLQDMLGFDKASKTVEWLLKQAGDNISKLTREVHGHTETQSSFSECEVVSGTEDAATEDVVDKLTREKQNSSSCAKNRIKKINVRQSKNEMFNSLAKASRKKARERARERTKEKMERLQVKTCNDVDQEAKKMLISWSTVQSGGGTQSPNNFNRHQSSFEVVLGDEIQEPTSRFQAPETTIQGVYSDLNEIDGQDVANLVTMGKWSPCSSTILSYLQNTSASISQEFADSQLFGKPWEVIYSSRPHYGL